MDTTAAGDSFTGGFLHQLIILEKSLIDLTKCDIAKAIRFANAVGSLTITKKGAISALPTLEEVTYLLNQK